ncbi:MAG: DUF1573 domain-containing protein [Rikenellaceae bacterium]
MRTIILMLCLLLSSNSLFAEGLTFDSVSWDFGTLAEEGESIRHTFTFKNESSQPVVVHNVRTSCGCTSSDFSRQPIAAGASSQISVEFDPLYQAGTVSKSIYVYSTASGEPQILTLKGVVTPRVRTLRERYPYTLGDGGRIEMLYLTIPGVARDDMAMMSVGYVNGSEQPMEVEFRSRREHKELKLFYDRGVAAGAEVTLEVGYFIERSLGRNEVLYDTLDLFVNGARSDKSLYIKGVASILF